jgi:hypothetical protein
MVRQTAFVSSRTRGGARLLAGAAWGMRRGGAGEGTPRSELPVGAAGGGCRWGCRWGCRSGLPAAPGWSLPASIVGACTRRAGGGRDNGGPRKGGRPGSTSLSNPGKEEQAAKWIQRHIEKKAAGVRERMVGDAATPGRGGASCPPPVRARVSVPRHHIIEPKKGRRRTMMEGRRKGVEGGRAVRRPWGAGRLCCGVTHHSAAPDPRSGWHRPLPSASCGEAGVHAMRRETRTKKRGAKVVVDATGGQAIHSQAPGPRRG